MVLLIFLYVFYCWCFSLLVSLHLPCQSYAWRWTLSVKWIKGILQVQEFKWLRKILYSSLKIYLFFWKAKTTSKILQENEKILLEEKKSRTSIAFSPREEKRTRYPLSVLAGLISTHPNQKMEEEPHPDLPFPAPSF